MRENLLARLRRMSQEAGDNGAPESRDTLINMFLDEVLDLVSGEVLREMKDSELRNAFYMWTTWSKVGPAERRKLLCKSVHLVPFVTLDDLPAPEATNVVSLR